MTLKSHRSFFASIRLVALCSVFTACGLDSRHHRSSDSKLHFLTFGSANTCTLRYARDPEIRICITGSAANGATLVKAKDYSKRAMLMWFRALRQIDDQVTSNVQFSCEKPHMKIDLRPGSSTSMSGCGWSTIYAERPYGTYLHEFGHGVAGLSDTYSGGSAGNCVPGQPKSIMCWGAYGPNDSEGFSKLFEDDVKGIQEQYRRTVKVAMTPSSFKIDPLAVLDPNHPWPVDSGSSANPGVTPNISTNPIVYPPSNSSVVPTINTNPIVYPPSNVNPSTDITFDPDVLADAKYRPGMHR